MGYLPCLRWKDKGENPQGYGVKTLSSILPQMQERNSDRHGIRSIVYEDQNAERIEKAA